MREDIRLQFDCEIASKKDKKASKKKKKQIIYLSDHICSSMKQQVAENNVLFLPTYQRSTKDEMTTLTSSYTIY